ncbi:NADPH:quinone oxidoreductase family protein [Halodurantibacterium flavum]|uniref:NADPH:quinone oxidoreductase family protein n=1 Tax=Halodurantibacterium flavum TaxID=1382802 RepID=A0ABW4S2C3_9RHOB
MNAILVSGHKTVPEIRTVALPSPGAGQVRIRIEACGLNFADLLMIEGTYQDTPAPPFILGMELSGTVEALGPGVTGPTPGSRVAVMAGQGGLAEYGCFDASSCLPLPDAMSFEEAAGFQIAYGTSHLALSRRAALQAGETLLVLGAAGGVGLTAVEIGAIMGARVIAVARGAEKLGAAERAGAHHLLDSDDPDLVQKLRDLGGADVVYDPVGGEGFATALRATRPEGRILVIGFASGSLPKIPANHLLVKNVSVLGFYWGGYMRFRPDALRDSLAELLDWYARGRLRPHLSHVLPLDRTVEGLTLLRERKSTGKVVIRTRAAPVS